MNAEARGDLAERLIPKALDLAGLVHGDGGAADIDRFLRRLTLDGARDELRDLGMDEDSVDEALATMRDQGMFDVPDWGLR